MTGMKNNDTGKIENSSGMISQETGLIDNNTGMLEEDSGLITENNDKENTVTERKKRSRERGKDNKPRNFPLHTLKNLPQFRDKSHEEVRQYILEKKGVDIGSNFSWNKTIMWIFVAISIAVAGITIWKICQRHQNKIETENNEIIGARYKC